MLSHTNSRMQQRCVLIDWAFPLTCVKRHLGVHGNAIIYLTIIFTLELAVG